MFINKDKISARLCEERQKTGLNQDDFAALAGVGIATQTRYETGKNLPKLEYLMLLEIAGVDAAYILTGIRDGSISDQQELLLGYFERMSPEQRSNLLIVAEGLAGLPRPDNGHMKMHQSQTLHSPSVTYTPEPRDVS